MNFFAFLVLGLLAGIIARMILGRHHGWFATLIVGALGAMVGGWLGNLIFGVGVNEFWSLSSWVLAVGGAVIVLAIYGAVSGRNKVQR